MRANRKEDSDKSFWAVLQVAWVLALAATLMGCTAMQLEYSTVAHASTFTDIVSKVVLDNLAMFKENEGAVPAQVVITQGSITISDQVNPYFSYTWPAFFRVLGLSASRTWEETWSVVPVTDYAALTTLRYLYQQCATSRKIDENLMKQMAQTEIKDVEKISGCDTWLESGSVPGGVPFGHHGTVFVWVKSGQSKAFGDFVMQVMQVAGNAPKAQTFTFPGAVVPPRR